MIRVLFITIAATLVLPLAGICSSREVFPVAHSDAVTVRVLDGRSGGPQPKRHVILTGGYDRRDLAQGQWREEAITDSQGSLLLSNELRNLPFLRVEVLKTHGCQPDAGQAVVSVERIRLSGVSSANRCGTVVVADVPGVLTIFVKGTKGALPSLLIPVPPPVEAAVVAAVAAGPRPLPVSTAPVAPGKFGEPPSETAPAVANVPAHPSSTAPSLADDSIPALLAFPYQSSFADVPPPPASPVHVVRRRTRPLQRPQHSGADASTLGSKASPVPSPAAHPKPADPAVPTAQPPAKPNAAKSKAAPSLASDPAASQTSAKPAPGAQPAAGLSRIPSSLPVNPLRARSGRRSAATPSHPLAANLDAGQRPQPVQTSAEPASARPTSAATLPLQSSDDLYIPVSTHQPARLDALPDDDANPMCASGFE